MKSADWEYTYKYRFPAYPNDPNSYPKYLVNFVRENVHATEIKVELREGDYVQILLEEQTWTAWKTRVNATIHEGESYENEIYVDSLYFDADHRLRILTFNPNRAVRCWVYRADKRD